MLFVNESQSLVKVAIGKGYEVPPNGTLEVQDGYAKPKRADNGSRRPSVIEMIAPQLKPADPVERAEWELAPPSRFRMPKVAHMPTVHGLMANGISQGQAEMIVRQAHEAALASLPGAQAQAGKKEKR